jgi:hypothetical protein
MSFFFKIDYVKLELLQKNLFESWLDPITKHIASPMTDNNYFDNFPSTKSYGPHVYNIRISTSSKAMRVYA